MTRLIKALLLSFIFINMISLTSCNTVKGTMEGAGKDIQTVTGGGSNKAAAQSSNAAYKQAQVSQTTTTKTTSTKSTSN